MRSLVQVLAVVALAIAAVSSREATGERRVSRPPSKGKRGINDFSASYSSGGPAYNSPIHSSPSSGYNGGSLGGYSLGHSASIGNFGAGSLGHGSVGYSLGSGGLAHGLGLQGLALGGHVGQSSYSAPSYASVGGGGGIGLFSPSSKNGPVTFGAHGGSISASSSAASGYSAPAYATGVQGLSAYGGGASSSVSLPSMLGSGHSSSYSLPSQSLSSLGGSSIHGLPMSIQSIAPSSSYPVSGGLVIDAASLGKGSSVYSLPSTHSSGGASSYSHGISSLSGSSDGAAGYSLPVSSGSSSSHIGLSSGSSDSSSYSLPVSGSSGSSSYPSAGTSSYSGPSVTYAGSGSGSGSGPGSSYSTPVSAYSSPGSSYSASSGGYSPTYSAPSTSYGTPVESHASYSSFSPRYVGYSGSKSYDGSTGSGNKYDTISYSSPSGKY